MCLCAGAYKAKWLLAAMLLAEFALYAAYPPLVGTALPSPGAFAPTPGQAKPLPADPVKILTDVLMTR